MYDYEKWTAKQKQIDQTFDLILSIGIVLFVAYVLYRWLA